MPLDGPFGVPSRNALSPFYDNGFDHYVKQIVSSGEFRDQWLRRIQLIVSTGDVSNAGGTAAGKGQGIELSNLRIVFHQKKTTGPTPNLLTARVYNLSQNTINKIISGIDKNNQATGTDLQPGQSGPVQPSNDQRQVFTKVTLSAGYQKGRFGTIFDGTVFQYVIGKENPVDTYMDIWGGDGDIPINFATVNVNLPAGSTLQDRAKILLGRLEALGSKTGGKVDLGKNADKKSDRGVVLFGMVRDRLTELMNMAQADWFIDNGEVVVLRREFYRDGEIPYLSPKTGLIGMPQVTPQGIQIKCLLNPALQLGGIVKLDTDVLSGVPYLPGADLKKNSAGILVPQSQGTTDNVDQFVQRSGEVLLNKTYTAPISPVGKYKIFALEHTGDTRGNSWYSDMTCLAVDNNDKVLAVGGDIYKRISAGVEETVQRAGSTRAGGPDT